VTGPIPSPDAFRAELAAALAPAYELGRELEGGGMSRVFLAEERALGRPVVVKVLPPDLAAGVNRERFTREIQLAARLQHPHIVPLLSAGEAAGSLYYTMPYIEGESLRAELARGRRFTVRDVVRVLHDVVEALAHAHARGVIHRDVKPGNVLMLGAHALVTDFGVAKALSAARQHGQPALPAGSVVTHAGTTTAGLAIGTPAYMAPEQLAADPAADHRVDLYAAGLLAYELLVGESPFRADSPQATLAAQLTRMPTPLHLVRPDVPTALSQVIERCLAKDPDSRYQTADALLVDLEAVSPLVAAGGAAGPSYVDSDAATPAGTLPVTAALQPPVTVSLAVVPSGQDATLAGAPATRPRRRRPTAVLGGAVLGMGLVLFGGWAVVRGRETAAAPTPIAPTPVVAAPVAPIVPPPVAPSLSHDDSLAIAAAVERRFAAEERARRAKATPTLSAPEMETLKAAAWQHAADSIRESVTQQLGKSLGPLGVRGDMPRMFVDAGLAAANAAAGTGAALNTAAEALGRGAGRGRPEMRMEVRTDPQTQLWVARFGERLPPPKAGVRRVAVIDLMDGSQRHELREEVGALNDALRKAVATKAGYELADPQVVREAVRAGLPPNAIATVTHSGAVIFGTAFIQRDSQLVAVTQVLDARRGWPRMVQIKQRAPDGTMRALADAVGEPVTGALERVLWTAPANGPTMVVPTAPPPAVSPTGPKKP
jgi:serine/threonine-protein kinase